MWFFLKKRHFSQFFIKKFENIRFFLIYGIESNNKSFEIYIEIFYNYVILKAHGDETVSTCLP